MELKIWVEGLQRIVCGVNDKTTCQDVVFALAHATGKTGRFTLIERWRNSERLLAPTEFPLKVLMKWGEHSSEVQFILQWSPIEPKTESKEERPSSPPPYRQPPIHTPVNQSKDLPPYRQPPPPNNSPHLYPQDYNGLIHLINRQRERLSLQQAELTQHDAEITYWERKRREEEREMDGAGKEICRLEGLSIDQETQVLSLAHLHTEEDVVEREETCLRTETHRLRDLLQGQEQDLRLNTQTIRSLSEELASREEELESLRREVESAREETEGVERLWSSLEKDTLSIEASLTEKRREMDILVALMKEANLESLSIQLGEESHFPPRRRIRGSARQLKDTAPTNRHPHGVWV